MTDCEHDFERFRAPWFDDFGRANQDAARICLKCKLVQSGRWGIEWDDAPIDLARWSWQIAPPTAEKIVAQKLRARAEQAVKAEAEEKMSALRVEHERRLAALEVAG